MNRIIRAVIGRKSSNSLTMVSATRGYRARLSRSAESVEGDEVDGYPYDRNGPDQGGELLAQGGELTPQGGELRGELRPQRGELWGELTPQGGELEPETGELHSETGELNPETVGLGTPQLPRGTWLPTVVRRPAHHARGGRP
jgi:hypothetical protein